MTPRRGMTLLELLLALSLLATLAILLMGWVMTVQRQAARMRVAGTQARNREELLRLLQDDLSGVIDAAQGDRGIQSGSPGVTGVSGVTTIISFRTLSHQPEDPPGAMDVTYDYDPAHQALYRRLGPAPVAPTVLPSSDPQIQPGAVVPAGRLVIANCGVISIHRDQDGTYVVNGQDLQGPGEPTHLWRQRIGVPQ